MLPFYLSCGFEGSELSRKIQIILLILSKIIKLVQKVPFMSIRVHTNSLESAKVQSLIILLWKTVKPINFSYGYSKFLKNYKTDC